MLEFAVDNEAKRKVRTECEHNYYNKTKTKQRKR